ncbi:MAG: YibE/F family protein, partial [Chloroflexi bacterium]
KSTAAIGGTAVALVLIVVLSQLAIGVARLTGLVGDDMASTVFVLFDGAIDARGLLLSGILIGALGALDDVTMTQSSAVFELRDANPALRVRDLYARGMRIGRDHIASIVNTLVLAYAGASMPLLVILASQTEGFGTLLNREFLAAEVVRTVVGSVGIVAAVPLTTAIAAWFAARESAQPAPPARPATSTPPA